MALHPQVQRLDALKQQKRRKRCERSAVHAQNLHARLHRVGEIAERLPEFDSVVGPRWRNHVRKPAVAPVEPAAFDQHAAERGSVSAEVFGRGVHDDVRAPVERPTQVRRGHRVVDHQRNTGAVRNARDRLDVQHVDLRVAERLGIQQARVVAQRGAEVVWLVGVDEGGLDSHLAQRHVELRVSPPVEQRRRNDVLTGLDDREDSCQLGRHPARRRKRRAPVFQCGDALFQYGDSRIADARVDVAERLQIEQARRVIGGVENVGGRLVDRRCAAASHGVRNLPGMQAQGLDAERTVGHARLQNLSQSPRRSRRSRMGCRARRGEGTIASSKDPSRNNAMRPMRPRAAGLPR